jgi:hypothetical protein
MMTVNSFPYFAEVLAFLYHFHQYYHSYNEEKLLIDLKDPKYLISFTASTGKDDTNPNEGGDVSEEVEKKTSNKISTRVSVDYKLFPKIKKAVFRRQKVVSESLLWLRLSQLKDFCLEYIDFILKEPATLTFRAAEVIAIALQDMELLQKLKTQFLFYRIEYYTKSRDDGWNLAFEVRLAFFRCFESLSYIFLCSESQIARVTNISF